jgi:uncharacterized protein (DUF1501 family)
MSMRRFQRRAFLKGGAVVAASLGLPTLPGFARRALAQTESAGPGRRRTFVFLFLRGALDGLYAVAPYGEARLASLRPGLALPPPDGQKKSDNQKPLLSLGVPGFGLHPALEPLLPSFREGTLAIVHAVGSPDPTRSHFDAQDALELGTPGVKSTPQGWLARALAALPAPEAKTPLDAIAIAQRLPRALQGDKEALAFGNIEQLRLRPLAGGPGGDKGREQSRGAFEAMYAQAPDLALAEAGKEAFAALTLLDRKLGKTAPPPANGAQYPQNGISAALKQIAALIRADVGLRVACADAPAGWDTHAGQPGLLMRALGDLGQALAAFRQDLGERLSDVTLVVATEFGRTVRQNGALGTDHGHGSVAFVLGGNVAGGRILGRWPGLEDEQLYEGRDLAVTTDLRAVLASAARAQLGPFDVQRVFPGLASAPFPGLIRGTS